ncbi:hypothetical protein SAMN05216316_0728 [Nitrosovibrio sp. Nv6]|nr:hypothetical protein SAMN05216316_0728 [Nitrosovibrio sp. Nv6]
MGKSYHMCLDVRGALTNWSDRNFRGVFTHDDGRKMTPAEAKSNLLDELSKGHEVIPCGKCDNFDFSGEGCLGHDA